MTAKQTKHV